MRRVLAQSMLYLPCGLCGFECIRLFFQALRTELLTGCLPLLVSERWVGACIDESLKCLLIQGRHQRCVARIISPVDSHPVLN